MKLAYFGCLLLCLTTTLMVPQSPVPQINQSAKVAPPISAPKADPKAEGKILDQYGKLPLSFEVNQGQTGSRVKFLSRTSGYSLFLTGDEAVLTLSGKRASTNKAKIEGADHKLQSGMAAPKGGGVLRMKLRNANPAAQVTGVDELAGTSNYFIGNDSTKWRTNVPTYGKVKYEGIYSGIDLIYHGNQRQLEYDFIVAPGVDPRRIAFEVSGAKRIRCDSDGDLVFKVGEGDIRWHKPVVYQEKDGTRKEIPARYAITDKNRVGFELAKYDTSSPLYIDPLIYSTYLGGSTADRGFGITVDNEGNAYVTGVTESPNFPTTPGAFQTMDTDTTFWYAFVSKINATGSALVYSTYLGGSSYYDNHFGSSGYSIAVDGAGNAYVTGYTTTTDFPVTPGVFQTTCNVGIDCIDAFVTKLNPSGSALVYSTYLGGGNTDAGSGIAVDSEGNAYVTGYTESTNFPTMSPLQAANGGGSDAFVAKLNSAGSALVYSTYIGGSGNESGGDIAMDSAGNAYVTGSTQSTDFPTMNALQPTYGGGYDDAFVAKINASGSALIYSTYIGGSEQDAGSGIAVDSKGNAYVTGLTTSTDFPTTPGAFQTICGCQYDGDSFVFKLNPTGSALVYSTYLGATSFYGVGSRIAVGSEGNAYVVGSAACGFPTTPGAVQTTCKKNGDAFVTKVNAAGSALVYSTYLGGGGIDSGADIAVDSVGNAYVTGFTSSPSGFPTKNPLQPTNAGQYDAFVTKIDMRTVPTITLSSSPNPSVYGQAVTFTAVVTSGLGAPPDGETVSFMKGTKVLGTGTLSGGLASFTTSTLPAGTDSIKAVYVGDSNFAASTSKTLSQVVSKATTTTTLSSSLNPSNVGQSVTFTANVTPQFSGPVNGSVTFYDGTTALKTAALSGGAAKFATSTLTSGSHSITATYNGSGSFDGSSASMTQTVN
jgi:hypothetical protein